MNNVIRIAWITTGFTEKEKDIGGAAAINNLARELSLYSKIELTIFSFYYPFDQPEYEFYKAKVYSFAGNKLHKKIDKPGIWRKCMSKFADEHKKKKFDVIHSMWAGESGNIAAKLSKKHGVPLIVNICGGELAEIKEINYGSRLKFWQKRFVDNSLECADKIVAGSEYILEKIEKYYNKKVFEKAVEIPFGVDEKIFHPMKHPTPSLPALPSGRPEEKGEMFLENKNKRFKLINIANAVPVKDHETLFRAMKKVSEIFPNIKLDVYGKDEGKIFNKIIKETGTEGIVKINNFIEHGKIADILNENGIFVLSSLYESQNMSMLEAAFCGLPVVSTNVGVANEITEHVVETGDYEGLADKIVYVINNWEVEKRKASEKISKLHKIFSLVSSTNNFITLYKEISLNSPYDLK